MKKSIALVTNKHDGLAVFLEENLRLVLEDYISINRYSIENIKETDIINEDVVLVMSNDGLQLITKNILDNRNHLVIRRTIKNDNVHKILSIPDGTDVLVVNDTKETTLETMKLFYKIGVTNINLNPFIEGKDYRDIHFAITPGTSNYVPSHISEIIDLGHRYIDISTFIELIQMLDMYTKDIRANLKKYSETIVSLDSGIKKEYVELYLKIEELDTILDSTKDGILFTSNDNIVNIFNKQVVDILDLKADISGLSLDKIFSNELQSLLEKEEIVDEVILLNKKYINVNKKNIYNKYENIGVYYSLQEVTYIKKLEQNITKKLREKGHVAKYNFNELNFKNKDMLKCIEVSKKVSNLDCSILIIGESGTGKEVIAQSIHNHSNRKNQPFIAVNCAAVPENLLESQLFGYEKGTFTGGLKDGKLGLFEVANNGTIFLDEIAEMPILLQTKLLRVLQEKQVMPLGSHNVIDIDVRIIAATNKNLEKLIKEGKFREDLYYRLNVIPIKIPPLRDRKEDLLDILNKFLNENLTIMPDAKELILNNNWKGNIRELQNMALYINAMCDTTVTKDDLPDYIKNIEDNTNDIKLRYDKEDVRDVLEVFYYYTNIEKGIGRGIILDKILEKNKNMTEGKIRGILKYLNGENLINSQVGRTGSKITEKGINMYNILSTK